MVARPKALDLFCGAGGAAMGLHRAGFDVVGVDIVPQPRYPFKFIRADAMTFPLDGYWLIWASPPCQRYCALRGREDLSRYPDLLDPIRQRLNGSKSLTVIENVPGSPIRADITLCGAMFGLRSYRHRHFECNFPIGAPPHPKHLVRVNRRGENRRKHWDAGGFITVTGDVGTYCGPAAMGMGKTYRTRDGREVRIYAVDGGGLYPVHAAYLEPSCGWISAIYTARGHQHCDECDAAADLIEVKPTITRVEWRIQWETGWDATSAGYPSYEDAKRYVDSKVAYARALAITGPHEVTFTPGEGL